MATADPRSAGSPTQVPDDLEVAAPAAAHRTRSARTIEYVTYEEFGRLSFEMWRAARLVIDTGIHAYGWSREQGIEYLASHAALSRADIENEVDRYISSPGQATGYMIGRLEIQRMRREAEARQGAAFDIKQFHSAVLDSGGLPLAVLDRVVRRRCP